MIEEYVELLYEKIPVPQIIMARWNTADPSQEVDKSIIERTGHGAFIFAAEVASCENSNPVPSLLF